MSQAFPPLGPEFEPFLHAVVCDEVNGAPLTMVSAIARSGADPWQEAARIASLPKSGAFEALARLIPVSGEDESKAIAKRLFALLPAPRPNMNFRLAGSPPKSGGLFRNPLVPIVVALMLGLALVSFFKAATPSGAGPHEPPTTADKTDP
ncbi:hypothetical protein QM467_17850 [Rhodoblastus sp. 17X3]|uniref:hypothetical protein n=1 Tax=Rhodoblastus sp. 17X3 TaxID=3047026 RepID=UPI0024B7E9B9|nr:hypothetical protein [Rhodoblastus sp. 17X3]MDI9849909.1 hypothetical protein [Rhodoblastus sp. 17X3]